MAKLSPAQDKALNAWRVGEFPLGTNKRTIEALVKGGYVIEDNTFYNLTPDGREYLGLPPVPNTTVDEIQELLKPVHAGPLADWEKELIGIDPELPFTVQEWINGKWVILWEMNARTWGTANVRRNRLISLGRKVQVHNTTTGQVWA